MKKIGKRLNRPNVGPPPTQPTPVVPPVNYANDAMRNSNFGIGGIGPNSPMDIQKQSIPSLNEISTKITDVGSNFSINLDESIGPKEAWAEEDDDEVERADEETYTSEQFSTSDTQPWTAQQAEVDANMRSQIAEEEARETVIQPDLEDKIAFNDAEFHSYAQATEQGVVYYKHPRTDAILVNSANLERNPDIAKEWWDNENTKDVKVVGTSISSMKEDSIGTSNYGQTRFGEKGLIDQIAQQNQNRNEGFIKRQIMDDIGTGGFGYSSPNVSRTPAELEQAKAAEAERVTDTYGLTSFTNTDYTDMGKKGTKDVFGDPTLQPTTPITTPVSGKGGNKSVAPEFPGTKKGNLWLGSGAKDSIGTFGIKNTTVPGLVDFYKQKIDSGKTKGINESFGKMNTDFLSDMKDRWTFKDTKKQKIKKAKGPGGAGNLYDPTGFYKQS